MPKGTVEEVVGKYAVVEIMRNDMCGDCHACDVVHPAKKCTLKCLNKCESKAGDIVEISLDNTTFLKATLIMYGLPLIGLLVGLGIGAVIANILDTGSEELFMAIGGLLLAGVSLLWIKKRDKEEKYNKMVPQITKILQE